MEFFHKKYPEYECKEGMTEIHCQGLAGYATWDNMRDKILQNDLRKNFNIGNGILLINPTKDYVEMAGFCSTADNYKATVDFFISGKFLMIFHWIIGLPALLVVEG
jgi:hypothetical protein